MSRAYLEYHPVLAYRFVPGVKARVPSDSGGYLIRCNSQGFRSDREFEFARTPGTQRLLVFGDSFTAGDGVSNAQRYTDQLEASLADVQIYNFGLPGSGTDQQYLAYREYALRVESDLLVIAPLVENIRRVAAHYRQFVDERGREAVYAKPYYDLDESGALQLRNVPIQREPMLPSELTPGQKTALDSGGRFPVMRQMISAIGAKDLALKLTGYQPLPEYGDPQHPAWRVMRAILLQWIGEHRARGGRVLLSPLPLYHYIEDISDPTPYQTRFRELADEAGCAYHDMLDDLRQPSAAIRRAFRFERDVHLTPAGHSAVAASLRPVVASLLASAG